MRNLVQAIKRNDFMRNNAIFFVGSLSVSFINYLYYPVLGRLLTLEAFGELQVLLSFYMQIGVFISVLTLIATNIVLNEKKNKVTNDIISELEKFTLYVSYGLLILVALLSPLLMSAFKFESPLPFIVIMVVFSVSIPAAFRTAFLRGKNDFIATSIEGILTAITKLLASVFFVVLGFKAAGAAGGLVVAQIVALIYATYKARQLGFMRVKTARKPNWSILRPQARYSGLVLFVSFICTLQFSIDVAIVKYLFSPEIAGQYAGIATISRIVLFLTGSFSIVLLSSVKLQNTIRENITLLKRSLLLTLLFGGSVTLFFAALPVFTIHLLFGTRYDAFAHILPLLSIVMLAMSVSNLLANYHIALRNYTVMWYIGIGALASVIAISLHHGSPEAVVQGLAMGSATMLVGLTALTVPSLKLQG